MKPLMLIVLVYMIIRVQGKQKLYANLMFSCILRIKQLYIADKSSFEKKPHLLIIIYNY